MTGRRGLLLALGVMLIAVLLYLAWPREGPCVRVRAFEEDPRYHEVTLTDGHLVSTFSPELLPERLRRRYDAARSACERLTEGG